MWGNAYNNAGSLYTHKKKHKNGDGTFFQDGLIVLFELYSTVQVVQVYKCNSRQSSQTFPCECSDFV